MVTPFSVDAGGSLREKYVMPQKRQMLGILLAIGSSEQAVEFAREGSPGASFR
jgi:hypothetical protein